jgi:hypothetical protein
MNQIQKNSPVCETGPNTEDSNAGEIIPTAEKISNQEKQVSTIKAELALKGHAVIDLKNGEFLVTKWGLIRPCKTFEELCKFAAEMGVQHDAH